MPREYALAQARYAYLWNRFDDGWAFIQPFFELYRRMRILDDHFLYIRGLPFFGQAWGYLAALAILSGRLELLETETRFAVEHGQDYDFDYLQLSLQAYRDDRPELLLGAWANSCEETPSGNACLNVAIIRARAAETLPAAQAILSAVRLDEGDWPTLEDVRTLALAEAAYRHSDETREREYVEQFIARQPLLLEPDVALSFHLLRYQERLKPGVWHTDR
ncbi:MAG: hypothetical protein KatS3mg053_1695 [Candidatus Roseilinea sp.]|nr:MAG: hypothetical protein KatS3mg053_1695 [Candidatus Roseilinea sp.]